MLITCGIGSLALPYSIILYQSKHLFFVQQDNFMLFAKLDPPYLRMVYDGFWTLWITRMPWRSQDENSAEFIQYT